MTGPFLLQPCVSHSSCIEVALKHKSAKLTTSRLQVIGSHQLTPEQKEKATKRRTKLEAQMSKGKAREQQEAYQLKKLAKYEEEKVCMPFLTQVLPGMRTVLHT